MNLCTVLVVFFIADVTSIEGYVTCMLCNDARSLADCRETAKCADDEECFLEKVTRGLDLVVFNAGCRSRTVCLMTVVVNPIIGRRQVPDGLLNCVQCCGTSADKYGPCNNRLCNQKPIVDTRIRCLSCDYAVSSIDGCKNYKTCEPTQVCATTVEVFNSEPKYRFFCDERHLCRAFVSHTGNSRAANIITGDIHGTLDCYACCYGNHCNHANCYQLRRNGPLSPGSRKFIVGLFSISVTNVTINDLGSDPTTVKPTTRIKTTATNEPTTIKRTTAPPPSTRTPVPTTLTNTIV